MRRFRLLIEERVSENREMIVVSSNSRQQAHYIMRFKCMTKGDGSIFISSRERVDSRNDNITSSIKMEAPFDWLLTVVLRPLSAHVIKLNFQRYGGFFATWKIIRCGERVGIKLTNTISVNSIFSSSG